ncbi:uncharacterized protein [Montipora foliosa]|uniref:uncharacterized protein isoform X2 n=1 Tax=Montipora foliosa TaxID=591990 RepID=UPI0035F1D6AE
MEEHIKVTLGIYSGLPDPVWKFDSRNESFKTIKEHLDDARAKGITYRHKQMPSILGFRGFLVQLFDAEQADLIVGQKTAALQKLLLETMPEGLIRNDLRKKILQAIDSGAVSAKIIPDKTQSTTPKDVSRVVGKILHYAPPLNLARWNTNCVQPYNNCYNYANDKITNSFAQPGKASGKPITELTVAQVLAAVESDGWLKMDVPPEAPCPAAPEQPNCLVALFVAVDTDFHCMRLDNNKLWSQKLGSTAATNKDGAGKDISDPRKAVNLPYGPDYKFVSFMKFCTVIIE